MLVKTAEWSVRKHPVVQDIIPCNLLSHVAGAAVVTCQTEQRGSELLPTWKFVNSWTKAKATISAMQKDPGYNSAKAFHCINHHYLPVIPGQKFQNGSWKTALHSPTIYLSHLSHRMEETESSFFSPLLSELSVCLQNTDPHEGWEVTETQRQRERTETELMGKWNGKVTWHSSVFFLKCPTQNKSSKNVLCSNVLQTESALSSVMKLCR